MQDITISLTDDLYEAYHAELAGQPFGPIDAAVVTAGAQRLIEAHATAAHNNRRLWIAKESAKRDLAPDLEAELKDRLIAALAAEQAMAAAALAREMAVDEDEAASQGDLT